MTSILKISEATSIAFHAMVYLAKNKGKSARVREIAEAYDVSENHLSKVLQRLSKANLVDSAKGPNGGFKLHKESENISFLEIYEAMEGQIKQNCCLFEKQVCDGKSCIMGDIISKTNISVNEYFKNKKLSEFCD